MAGAGIRLFEAGEILTAELVNTYLMDQVVPRFATATTRNSSFGGAGQPTLGAGDEGRLCYLDSTNEIQYWNGSTWVSLGDQAVVGIVAAKGNLIVGTAANTITNLTVGVNGKVLTADSSTATGVAWSTPTVEPLAITNGEIANLTIMDGKIATSAAIAHTKLANATAGQVLLGTTTTGVVTATTVSGDVTITGAGVTTIGTGAVTTVKTNAVSANTADRIVARDGSGNFAAGTITATLTGNVTGNVTGTASNATKVNNYNVTVGPTAPASPSAGDIWIQATI